MYGPVIEPEHDGAFFSQNSDEFLRQGRFHRVPLLMGFNSNEAAVATEITGKSCWFLYLLSKMITCTSIFLKL